MIRMHVFLSFLTSKKWKETLAFNFNSQGDSLMKVSTSYHNCNLRDWELVTFTFNFWSANLTFIIKSFTYVRKVPLVVILVSKCLEGNLVLLGKASKEIWYLKAKFHQNPSKYSLVGKFFNNYKSEFFHVVINKVQWIVILFENWVHSEQVSIVVTVTRQTYLFKINNKNIRKRCEIWLKLTIKPFKRRQRRRSGVSTVNFQHILHFF